MTDEHRMDRAQDQPGEHGSPEETRIPEAHAAPVEAAVLTELPPSEGPAPQEGPSPDERQDESQSETEPAPSAEEEEEEEPKRSLLSSAFEFVVMVVLAFALAQVVRTFIVEPFIVPSGSMLPTIQLGDQLLVNKFIYRFEHPKYGDVVVLDDPTGETPMLIKRVIGVGGQTVDIREGKVWIDGKALTEPYTHGKPSVPGPVHTPIKLASDEVWVMGDNRTQSKDARWFGPQPYSSVHGKAFIVYWPLKRMGATLGP